MSITVINLKAKAFLPGMYRSCFIIIYSDRKKAWSKPWKYCKFAKGEKFSIYAVIYMHC